MAWADPPSEAEVRVTSIRAASHGWGDPVDRRLMWPNWRNARGRLAPDQGDQGVNGESRQRHAPCFADDGHRQYPEQGLAPERSQRRGRGQSGPVSYTHLTL